MKAKELPLGSAARGKTRRVIPPARYLETNTFAPLRTESAKPDFTTSAKCSISGRECVPLCRVMDDNAHCVTQPRADAADAVAKVYAIVVLGALHRTIVDSKSASVRMNRSQSDEKLKRENTGGQSDSHFAASGNQGEQPCATTILCIALCRRSPFWSRVRNLETGPAVSLPIVLSSLYHLHY